MPRLDAYHTKVEMRKSGAPRDRQDQHDMFAEMGQRGYRFQPSMLSTINAGKVSIGMTKDEARMAWGSPDDINTTTISAGSSEQWCYGPRDRRTFFPLFQRGSGYYHSKLTHETPLPTHARPVPVGITSPYMEAKFCAMNDAELLRAHAAAILPLTAEVNPPYEWTTAEMKRRLQVPRLGGHRRRRSALRSLLTAKHQINH
ncbi:MAG: hypothetical protein JWO82_2050 [Akkermansiaceae bacterium]|nr:hypothetical protein [Akkermansiaceae bacterium]